MAIRYEMIGLSDGRRWAQALECLPHPPGHRREYCAAMAESSRLETFLYAAGEGEAKVACPLSIRRKEEGFRELVSPYGFGGMAGTLPPGEAREVWLDFARKEGFATAYIMQHPAFPLADTTWGADLHEHHTLYLIDLTAEIDEIWRKMCKTHRYEVRKSEASRTALVVTDRPRLKQALLALYPQTVRRVGASEVYDFAPATLDRLADDPGALLVGVEEGEDIQALALFLHTRWAADYFLNASSAEGRRHTRQLVWTAIKSLKEMNVALLNLGGGVKPGDSLGQFKERFGGRAVPGQALKQILDREKYDCLCRRHCPGGVAEGGYFPPYWNSKRPYTAGSP